MAETSRAATLLAPDKIEIREYPIPDIPDDGGCFSRWRRGGVCGSDVKYYHGRINLPLPIILGHEILGRVHKLGSKAGEDPRRQGGRPGDHEGRHRLRPLRRLPAQRASVSAGTAPTTGGRTTSANPPHLFGGFADYLYLAPDVLMTKISEDLSAEAAALIGSVMANGFQWALRRGGVKMGDYVLIQGPGQQGLACTWASKHAGAGEDLRVRHRPGPAPHGTCEEVGRRPHHQRRGRERGGGGPGRDRRRLVRRGGGRVGKPQGDPRLHRLSAPPGGPWCWPASPATRPLPRSTWTSSCGGEIKLQGLLHRRQRRRGRDLAADGGDEVPGGGNGEPRVPAGGHREVHPGRGRARSRRCSRPRR